MEKAINDLSKAIMLKPDYAEAYYNRALVHYTLDEYLLAINDCKKLYNMIH